MGAGMLRRCFLAGRKGVSERGGGLLPPWILNLELGFGGGLLVFFSFAFHLEEEETTYSGPVAEQTCKVQGGEHFKYHFLVCIFLFG